MSPDNQNTGWQAGYQPSFENIGCFSHIHEWTLGGLGIMAANGELKTRVGDEQKPDEGRTYPVYLKPEKKLTIDDMKTMLRNHYEGTDHDPYSPVLNGNEPWRPISVFRTYESHVMHVRPWLPKEIGEVAFVGIGMAALSCYVPYYHGLESYPAHYGMGTDKADSKSIYWKYRKLQTLVMTDYQKLAPVVKAAYKTFEADTAKAQAEASELKREVFRLQQRLDSRK